ncbi:BnaC05g34920D [Brassica napus]|nr:BnaC05g34920D [Brassica napus]
MYAEDDQAHMELNRKASEPMTVPASHNQQRSSVSAKSKEQDKGTASSTVKRAFQIKLSNPFSALDLATDTDDDMCLSH